MISHVTIEEARANLEEMIAQLGPGDEVVITAGRRPVAKLIAEPRPVEQRPGLGLCREMITIVSDDDEHLRDFAEYMP